MTAQTLRMLAWHKNIRQYKSQETNGCTKVMISHLHRDLCNQVANDIFYPSSKVTVTQKTLWRAHHLHTVTLHIFPYLAEQRSCNFAGTRKWSHDSQKSHILSFTYSPTVLKEAMECLPLTCMCMQTHELDETFKWYQLNIKPQHTS